MVGQDGTRAGELRGSSFSVRVGWQHPQGPSAPSGCPGPTSPVGLPYCEPGQSLPGSGLPELMVKQGKGPGPWHMCAWQWLPPRPTPAAPSHPRLSLSAAISHVSGSLGDLLHFFPLTLKCNFLPQISFFL